MTYAQLLHRIPEGLRTLFRKYEKTSKKASNNKWSAEYNSVCLKENILPNYTYLKHYDPAIRPSKCTRRYQRYLVDREMKKQQHTITGLWTYIVKRKGSCFSCFDLYNHPVVEEVVARLDNGRVCDTCGQEFTSSDHRLRHMECHRVRRPETWRLRCTEHDKCLSKHVCH